MIVFPFPKILTIVIIQSDSEYMSTDMELDRLVEAIIQEADYLLSLKGKGLSHADKNKGGLYSLLH